MPVRPEERDSPGLEGLDEAGKRPAPRTGAGGGITGRSLIHRRWSIPGTAFNLPSWAGRGSCWNEFGRVSQQGWVWGDGQRWGDRSSDSLGVTASDDWIDSTSLCHYI
ncbi:hypothetical protein SKAU_G00393820 [Synaphobranchus kaupii]|uniref:Uncharacterized protein n=1 Tax=Synaphobranchus kaupii TaxID=118154 RepID=A0A9Q1EC17_SYNKA|nr:hypothetical protein SKAU_G00393820 [Synaphobranchus kaupii]